MALLFRGNVAHSKTIGEIEWLQDALVVVAPDGKISSVEVGGDVEATISKYQISPENVIRLEKTQFLMPGFVDTHIHAPQYVNAGLALDLPLLDWLNKYTFPTESHYADSEYARRIYTRVVTNTLTNGTTTAMYFATIHQEASLVLAELADRFGQRAFVGKVSMDINSPDFYTETTEDAVQKAELFARQVLDKKYARVQPAITPRFAVSCTGELLSSLGRLARDLNLNIQTHVAENRAECQFVAELFPQCSSYVDIYEKTDLLTPKTILAHGVYMSDEDLERLKEFGTSIAHCPNSNCSIRSGLCDSRRLIERGILVGLGTDVSGGYSPSLLDAMRFAITVSNVVSLNQPPSYRPLCYKDVFYMATMGGALALGLGHQIGSIEVGKDFDALVVDLAQTEGNLDLWPGESFEERLSKWIHLGDERSIRRVYVGGSEVKQEARRVLAEERTAGFQNC